jgi:hypothetical protein
MSDTRPSSRVARFRRRAVAACTVGFALLLFVNGMVAVGGTGSAEGAWRAATEQQGRLMAEVVLLFVSSALLVPAAAGIVRMTPGRGAVLAMIGGTLLVLGALGHIAIGTYTLVVSLLPGEGADAAQMVALLDRINQSSRLLLVLPLVVSFGLGTLVSFIALHRARIVPSWVLAAVATALTIHLLPVDGGLALSAVQNGLGLFGFAYLALRMVKAPPVDGSADAGAASVPGAPSGAGLPLLAD